MDPGDGGHPLNLTKRTPGGPQPARTPLGEFLLDPALEIKKEDKADRKEREGLFNTNEIEGRKGLYNTAAAAGGLTDQVVAAFSQKFVDVKPAALALWWQKRDRAWASEALDVVAAAAARPAAGGALFKPAQAEAAAAARLRAAAKHEEAAGAAARAAHALVRATEAAAAAGDRPGAAQLAAAKEEAGEKAAAALLAAEEAVAAHAKEAEAARAALLTLLRDESDDADDSAAEGPTRRAAEAGAVDVLGGARLDAPVRGVSSSRRAPSFSMH